MNPRSFFLGRQKPIKAKKTRLSAIAAAQTSLETRFQLIPAGQAGICIKPATTPIFDKLEYEVAGILAQAPERLRAGVKVVDDEYKFRWVVLDERYFPDLVKAVELACVTLAERGLNDKLVAAVFPFRREHQDSYWIYSYKRAAFYPFIPQEGSQHRENKLEVELAKAMERELPIERSLERWYPMWGMPLR